MCTTRIAESFRLHQQPENIDLLHLSSEHEPFELHFHIRLFTLFLFFAYGVGGGGTCDDRSIVSDGLMLSVCRYAR